MANTPKTLVLGLDGTSNHYDGDNTNVVKLFALLDKEDPGQQVVYYQPGIGTYYAPGVVSPVFEWIAGIIDQAVAWYLYQHVTDAYQFIMQNYAAGDRICIFGFSRGAYTARALAGMVHKIGLLPRDNIAQLSLAYKIYKSGDAELAAGFKRTFSRTVMVEFVGVWDTVASVGVVMGRTLPFTEANTTIKKFRHALSLDERRVKFRQNQYHRQTPDPSRTGPSPDSPKPPSRGFFKRKPQVLSTLQRMLGMEWRNESDTVEGGTDVQEVWFAGAHSDVGGGATANEELHALSSVPLRWMVREASNADCGIRFIPGALEQLGLAGQSKEPSNGIPSSAQGGAVGSSGAPPPAGTSGTSQSRPSAASLDAVDALASVHDQLKRQPLWWILELLPLSYVFQDPSGTWLRRWRINFGRGRRIQDPPNLHRSVQIRMNDSKLRYKPRAVWEKGTETWVD